MTYHQSFSPCSRKNWVRASSKVSYAVLLSKFSAVFCDSFSSLSYTRSICQLPIFSFFLFLFYFSSLPFATALLVYHKLITFVNRLFVIFNFNIRPRNYQSKRTVPKTSKLLNLKCFYIVAHLFLFVNPLLLRKIKKKYMAYFVYNYIILLNFECFYTIIIRNQPFVRLVWKNQ